MITIDSITFNIPLKVINRKVEMLYKRAERTENGVLRSELIGVYFNYDLEAGMSARNVSDYAALWLKITEPVENHTIVMPDVGGSRTFEAYFANIRDEVAKTGTTNYFRNLAFSVIATSPART
jgi:hypothetical protein